MNPHTRNFISLQFLAVGTALIAALYLSHVWLATAVLVIFFTLMLYKNVKGSRRREEVQQIIEDALQHTKGELIEAQRLAHIGNWYLDGATGEVTASEEVYLIQGLDPQKPFPKFRAENRAFYTLTQDSWDKVHRLVQENLTSGKGFDADLEAKRPDGTLIWITARSEAVRDQRGRIVGLRGTVQDITQRKRAEEALRRSEQHLEFLSNSVPALISYIDTDCCYRTCNDAYTHWFGIPKSQIIGRHMKEVLGEEAWKKIGPQVEAALTGQLVNFETKAPYLFGGTRWIHAIYSPDRAPDGTVIGLIIMVNDITHSKLIEESLRASESRLLEAQRLAKMGSWEFSLTRNDDINKNELQWSAECFRVFGFEPGEVPVTNDLFFSMVHPDDRSRIADAVSAAILHKRQYSIEHRIILRDGSERAVCEVGNPYYDEHGTPVRMIGTVQDITDRKKVQEALRASEERYRTLFTSMDEGFCIIEVKFGQDQRPVDYRLVEVNPAFEKQTGLTNAQGRWVLELVPKHDQHWFDIYGRVVLNGEPVRFEDEAKALNRCFDVYAFRVGKPGDWKVAVLFNDITERKKAETALQNWASELERRVEERTALLEEQTVRLRQLAVELTQAEQSERKRLAQVLHDHLQQLLVAARMRMEMIERKTPGIDKKAVDDMRSYIEQAVQASRSLTAELRPPVLYESGLGAGLQFLARKVEDQYKLKVILEFSTDAEPSSDFIKSILYSSVQELLFNIAKYAQVEDCFLKLSRAANRNIVVTLRDEGVGFDPDQINGSQTNGGFGLFSIRERIKALGGSFAVHSIPGEGALFEISVPDKAQEHQQESQELPFEEGKKAEERTRGIVKVLLADDHKIVRQSLANLLTAQPFVKEVIEAEDGDDVVRKFRDSDPDVVIMDLNMPKRNGIEATRILHRMDPTAKIIGLSVQTEHETAQTMMRAGAVAYFNKAAETDSLIETIKTFASS